MTATITQVLFIYAAGFAIALGVALLIKGFDWVLSRSDVSDGQDEPSA